MGFVIFLLLLAGVALLVMAFNEPDGECMFCEVIIGVGLLFISSMGFGFCYDRVDEKSGFHHANAGKSGRTAAVEQRQKADNVHQKFLDAVKDDPDFKIYFEKN